MTSEALSRLVSVVSRDDAVEAVRTLLAWLGEDTGRPGLVDTPERYVRALEELTAGYRTDPAQVLERQFEEQADEMIVVSGIPFVSLCEHHILPFTGTVTIGYIPIGDRVVGLSKLPRLVQAFASRLQIQERLTTQIAVTVQETLEPLGVGVVVQGRHTCTSLRGARSSNVMRTSCTLGVMRDKPEARAEFLSMVPLYEG